MRFLVKATIPSAAGNAMVRDANMQSKMESVMADVRPEATYFTVEEGQRTIYFVVNLEGVEDMPRVAEPLWLAWSADLTFMPAFVPEDMEKAMGVVAEMAQKY